MNRGHNQHMRRRVPGRGFTLIEVLMALTILLVGVVGVLALFSVGLGSHRRAVDYTIAANLAASVFEDIAANYDVYYYDRTGNGMPDLSEDRNANGIPDWFELENGRPRYPIPYQRGYLYTIQYERSPDAPQSLLVTVRVYWRQAGVERAEVFQRGVFIKGLPLLDE